MEGVNEQDGKNTNIPQRLIQVGGLYQQPFLTLKSVFLVSTAFIQWKMK